MPEATTAAKAATPPVPSEPDSAPAAAEADNPVVEDAKPDPAEAISEVGESGKAAIRKEREARADLERKLAESERLQTELAKKVREFEDRDKTEQQKLTDQVAELQRQVTAKEAEIAKALHASLRAEVAAEKGVPISGLTGATKEELHASADELIAWRDAAAAKRPPKSPAPTTGLKSGASTTGDHPVDGKERAAQAMRQFRAGGA